MRSFHIITFGCQMNEHDSERMSGMLEGEGCSLTSAPEQADMIILNTCSIREKAEQKFYSELGRLKALKDERPGLTIAVAGCIAQQEGKAILSRAPYVDLVFGPSDIAQLPQFIQGRLNGGAPVIEISGDSEYHRKVLPASRGDKLKAWVSIMYGCDNFCTYCVVPYLRGRERSRRPADIVAEVRDLADRGYKEITLLGQNVNSYGRGLEEPASFPELLALLDAVPGLARIRFMTSHPRDLSDGLISAISDLRRVCEALHLPVQSGSNSVLRSMNRKYSREEYLDKMKRLRQAVPGIALSTDIIAGFPGESERDFGDTLDMLNEVRFDSIFAFKYSRRPGTRALELPGHIDEPVKEERLSRILELQRSITLQKNRDLIGTVQEILVEGTSKKGGTLTGRTRGNRTVNVSAPESLVGSLVSVTITAAGANSLTGTLCE